MHHTIAFAEKLTCDGAWAFINGLADRSVTVNVDDIYIPKDFNKIIATIAGGQQIRRARLSSPSLRAFSIHYLDPVAAEDGADNPRSMSFHPLSVIPLISTEALNAEVYSAVGGATTYDYWVAVLLAKGAVAPITGDIRTIRFTTSGTPVAKQWTNLTLAFAETLPVGRYQVVGCDLQSGSGIAFRLVPVEGIPYPGGFTHWSHSVAIPQQRKGALGVWTEFDAYTPPSIDVFHTGTDTPTAGYMDLIKVS